MLRRIGWLFILVPGLAVVPLTASADDWANPSPSVFAPGGKYGFKVIPDKSFEAATGVLFALDAEGQDQVVWSQKLVNIPARVFVSDRGKHVVTVDSYADLGRAHSLVVYDDKGKIRADYKLEDLLSEEDLRDRFVTTSPNRWWASEASFEFDLQTNYEHFRINTKWGAVLTVDLKSGKVAKSGFSLKLLLTEALYDPIAPGKGMLKCVLRNDTGWPIRIPVSFDDRTIDIESGPMSLAKTSRIDLDSSADTQVILNVRYVKPLSEAVLFELPLDDILAKGDKPHQDWQWDWPAGKFKPLSPIHKPGAAGYLEAARFQMKMQYGKYKLVSNQIVLKVKPSEASGQLSSKP